MPLKRSFALPQTLSPLAHLGVEVAEGIANNDPARIGRTLVEAYYHEFLPGQIVAPTTSRQAFEDHLSGALPIFGPIDGDLKELVVSEETNTAVVHIGVKGTFSFGLQYDNDNVFIMHAAKQPDGSLKFVNGKEFVNTKTGELIMQHVHKAK